MHMHQISVEHDLVAVSFALAVAVVLLDLILGKF